MGQINIKKNFCPTDSKFATCSDDGTVRVFDFLRCQEERVMRGHGADVKCVDWHPQKSLVVSGSKDNQQPIKLWDPKSGQALSTLHAHKSTVMDLKWNDNGNWLVTASRDHLLKLFDLRNLKEDMQTFRGHKKEASSVCWNPVHEGLIVSGGSDGQILFWNVGTDKEIGGIEAAHESIVWTLAWHPVGHILCSGSNDHTVKFWTRNRPGDQMRDKYNLNTLPANLAGLEDYEMDEHIVIPGMGIEHSNEEDDYIEQEMPEMMQAAQEEGQFSTNHVNSEIHLENGIIPGLDIDAPIKKPFVKPIPKNFQEQWNVESKVDKSSVHQNRSTNELDLLKNAHSIVAKVNEKIPGVIKIEEFRPNRMLIYGKEIEVKPGMKLMQALSEGADALYCYLSSGMIEEINDSMNSGENGNGFFAQDDNFEPQAKRFRTDDGYDRENSNSNDSQKFNNPSSGNIPSLLNLNFEAPPPITNNTNTNNINSSNNGNQQKPTQRNREGRRQGSRWSSRR